MKLRSALLFIVLLGLLSACARPRTEAYREFYAHLHAKPLREPISPSDYFLIIYIDAPHLDYTESHSLLKTIAKHPSDGSKNRDVGHCWIYLQGLNAQGEIVSIEGGHSGERGILQAKYFDGIMNYIDYGYANPSLNQCAQPRYEPNPVKYLWTTQADGFFQQGSGGHTPTSTMRINLTPEQFENIANFIHNYRYDQYAITGNQCTTFVVQIAALADIEVECCVTIDIPKELYLDGCTFTLWEDPAYARLTFATPDMLEKSLILTNIHRKERKEQKGCN